MPITALGGDISSLSSQTDFTTRNQQRSGVFHPFRHLATTPKSYRTYSRALARHSMAKKSLAEKNRTTPHPPAVFGSQTIISFIFLQTRPSEHASDGGFAENQN